MSVYIEKMEVYVGKHFIWLRSDASQGCRFVLIYLSKTPFCHPYFECSNSLDRLHVVFILSSLCAVSIEFSFPRFVP